MLPQVLICIGLAAVTACLATPLVRWAARMVGMVDNPDAIRKLQSDAISLGGGLAVFVSTCIGFAAVILIDRGFFGGDLGPLNIRYHGLIAAAAGILAVGLVDDRWTLRGRQKLLLQIVIVSMLVGAGTQIRQIGLFGYTVQLGVFAFPITVLWLLVAINALNLIDGADGMATTVGAIVCFGLGWLSFQQGGHFNGILCFALAGSLTGFLLYNKPPATIYLGDAGSMMIGLCVGVLSIWTNFKESTLLSSAPIAILALPLFDSTAAIMRRWLTGRSIYTTDRAHLHHLLQQRYGARKMLVFVAFLCGTTTLLSVLSIQLRIPALAGIGVLIVLTLLISTRSFGHAEARLLVGRAFGFCQSFAVAPHRVEEKRQQRRVPLQGDGQWQSNVWDPLVAFAAGNGFARVKMDLNLAWLHEGYHANWQALRLPDKCDQINMMVPLFAACNGFEKPVQIGRLQVVVAAADPSVYDRIGALTDYLERMQPSIEAVIVDIERTLAEEKARRAAEKTSRRPAKTTPTIDSGAATPTPTFGVDPVREPVLQPSLGSAAVAQTAEVG